MAHTESREWLVLFSDGSRKTLHGTQVDVIALKALTYLTGLRKKFELLAIIDEANAKIYGDFDWNLTYSEKDKQWLTSNTKLHTTDDIHLAVMSYARFMGYDLTVAANWLLRQEF